MANFNKVILIGNITRDPQLSYLPSGASVVELGLAVNRRWVGQDGQQRDETCFVDCRMFGKRAEVIQRYLKKGDPLFVEGRLVFDSWTAQDGSKRSRLRVHIENFEFLGKSGSSGGGGYSQAGDSQYSGGAQQGGYQPPPGGYNQSSQPAPPPPPPAQQPPAPEPDNNMPMGDDSFDPDDIPF